MIKLKGNSIFEGVIIAKARMIKREIKEIKIHSISSEEIEYEIIRFETALDNVKNDLKHLIDSLNGKVKKADLKILNAHKMMLEDPVFLSDITTKIRIEKINAEKVIDLVVKKYAGMFRSLSDATYRQRAIDVEDVGEKLILALQGEKKNYKYLNNKILITKDLKPSDILRYHNEGIKILGIVTEIAGETSHSAILAKTLGIPTLMEVKNLDSYNWEKYGDVILDTRGTSEHLLINPDTEIKKWYIKELEELKLKNELLKKLIGKPAKTKDNKRIFLNANIGGVAEIEEINKYKPDGVGLLRTEFLYMDSNDFPTEDEQFEIYKKISEELGKDKYLTVRTLDIGADKKLKYFTIPEEENPALGLRAIRISLKYKDIFKTQLKAILRASNYGNIKIMYPMIASLDEILAANTILEEAKLELRNAKIGFDDNIKVGIMIEIPSIAILADFIVNEVDFFSVGTNDLTQYLLAADRLSHEVANVYTNYHPAVLRIINSVAEIAIKNGKKISICGEMGGESMGVLAFLSFGITEFSMLPSLIPKVKMLIQNIDEKALKGLKEKLLSSMTTEEIKRNLNDYILGVM
ncbi:phosphoenolpyruvate--protein phosphotransferase [Haliovirga abyssi]|uniref:Phosphoenolpyruvate-protein phosphotransferase n=1 Tax=Haliovirga abyssi TaxID=2996794 RepID=A0AAU9DC61_9FUSO|nr:phosphoenolpyruvate--protein phosphotransferase [Haliovirga abyssi]BDU49877.1 phosphoenolpyruvate-protein phosphotransferase [Haliovirga abyssi]